ncbi:T6D22.19, putative [Theobroma cacao]|uniref:T6D22.19, putative n=1 Tax=Theobroma cacao TaxID=3641 RepID=A0A061FRC2_THECC|nr:T6D22.19, putative [Theobroma cacao]
MNVSRDIAAVVTGSRRVPGCDMLVEAIIKHELPYAFVEYDKIRAWAQYVNPNVVMHCRNTTISDVRRIHLREKEKLKQVMVKVPNRICLTSDVWITSTFEDYICLTAHFVNENWKLCSKLLNFCRMLPPHIGVELAATVFDCLKEWGIDKKVFSLSLDNASATDNMKAALKATFICK